MRSMRCCYVKNISIEESISLFGHKRGTNPKELVYHLQNDFCIETNKLTRINKKTQLPSLCIVRVCWEGLNSSHWIIYNNGVIYDSVFGKFNYSKTAYSNYRGKLTSYIKLKA